ncbi:hypothetical protein SESBI_16649 [Sesbania bispinosa]|nr:hypothetical protein SESBI_16649 [Sesbania bispinosa]
MRRQICPRDGSTARNVETEYYSEDTLLYDAPETHLIGGDACTQLLGGDAGCRRRCPPWTRDGNSRKRRNGEEERRYSIV